MTTSIATNPAASALQERWERLRSHKRTISRVKLLVEWEQGEAHERANAVTVDVSHSGSNLLRPFFLRQTLLNCFEILETVLNDGLFDVILRHCDRPQESCGNR